MNKDRLVTIFKDLVAIDSPTGEETAFAEALSERLTELGLKVNTDSYGNLYARLEGKGESVFFAAHMDTVEPGRGIKAVVKSGNLVSDGDTILGADNKTAITAMLELLHQISEESVVTRPIEFIFTRSEEVGNYGAINFDYSQLKATKGYCFDSSQAVGTIVTGSPFYERFDITLIGKDAHASVPEDGVNTLQILHRFLSKVTIGRLDELSVINIGMVNAGQVRNTVPGSLYLGGELRSFKEKELERHKARFMRMLDKVVYRFNASYEAEWVRENPGYRLTEGDGKVFIDETADIIESAGLKPKRTRTWGVSDANIFNDKGLLCINLADGSENSHSTAETQPLRELRRLVTVMKAIAKHGV